MSGERDLIETVFRRFLESGSLPDELPNEIMGYDYGDEKWNSAVHYLVHVVTDSDIRSRSPELDNEMRSKLRDTVEGLQELRNQND